METLQNILNTIENNGLIVTLLSGGVIVTLFVHARNILTSLWQSLIRLITFNINNRFNVQYEQPELLKKIMFLLNEKSKILWAKQVEISRVSEDRDGNYMSIPHGISYRLMYGSFIIVRKEFETDGMRLATIINITVFFTNKKRFLEKFIEDVKNTNVKESNNNIVVEMLGVMGTEKQKRDYSTIYSVDDAPKKLVEDAIAFINNESIYNTCSIPYKRNYLLYGKPGTGKSSSVIALASALNWNIVCIDLNNNRIDTITRSMLCRTNTIFLFEDIDAISKNLNERKNQRDTDREQECNSDITLSELLNLTDGLMTKHCSICIFTTNHIEALDEAFLRDGRMDKKIEFKYFDSNTASRMIKEKLDIDIIAKDDVCPATLQESILQVKLGAKTIGDFTNEWTKC